MPFIAKLRSTGERVDITKIPNPRETLRKDDVFCALPDCEAPMIIKRGLVVTPHFAHHPNSPCKSEYGSHPESIEHREGKRWIAAQLLLEREYQHANCTIEYEVPIPEVHRIADVLVSFPSGWRVAHECQLANITTEELEQRTEDYERAGVDVYWWLGKGAATRTNVSWACIHQGCGLELSFSHGWRRYDPSEGDRLLPD